MSNEQDLKTAQAEFRGIGTLGEKTLHSAIKHYIEPDSSKHEVKIGAFVADIVTDEGIIEIQTRAFDKLRKKLAAFLEISPVMLVYPLPRVKYLMWIDGKTGDVSKKRKSPKLGNIGNAIPELYKIKPFLNHPNFHLLILLVDLEEYRYLNGWSKDGKRGSTRCDRVPIGIAEEIHIKCVADFAKFIPQSLPDGFTSKTFREVTKTSLKNAQTTLHILNHLGIVRRVGKQGNLHIYERA
ncbi:MAG: hypothetical protein FWH17_08045 [Oscillospiraceae bacterium]|nr:hypothetical protein [Oscillospiraceae bacterium]